jgi:ABC-2 type transport system permease protein
MEGAMGNREQTLEAPAVHRDDIAAAMNPPDAPRTYHLQAPRLGLFNAALWLKSFRESWVLLAALCLLMFGFAWIYVWVVSKIERPALLSFFTSALKDFEALSAVPFQDVVTPAGVIALAFIHPLVQFTFVVWAAGRGSDIVAGELERGTMEMLVAQPIGRSAIFISKVAVAIVGLVVLSAALWAGISVGLRVVVPDDPVWPGLFLPAALNVLGLGFTVLGIAALVSSIDRYRWRTIGIVGSIYALSIITDVIARMAPGWEWMRYCSIFSVFEPQRLVAKPDEAWSILAQHNGVFLLLGASCLLAAGVIFARRDLPAPL